MSPEELSDALGNSGDLAGGFADEAEDAEDDAATAGATDNASWSQADEQDQLEPQGQDSNIENAKIELSPNDMQTAAGHHHHHKHYVHGKMEMGAHTGKKGSFGWHSKYPVGGKGRR